MADKTVEQVAGALFTPRRQAAFLRALAEAGNVSLACATAGVKRSRVYRARRRDAAFADQWSTALDAAAARVADGCGDARATIVRRSCRGQLQRRIPRAHDWTEADDERFLAALIEHGNAAAAARAIGKYSSTAYRRRRTRPEFRAAWDAALDEAVLGLEWALVERANAALRLPETEGAPGAAGVAADPTLALAIVKHHAAKRAGAPRRVGKRPRSRDLGAVRDSILDKLAAIARHSHDK